MAGCAAGHRRAKPLAEALAALSVAGQSPARFADSRPSQGTENLRRRYALVQKQLKFLCGAQRASSSSQLRIKIRLSGDQTDGRLPNVLLLLVRSRALVLLGRGRIRETRSIRILMPHRAAAGKEDYSRGQQSMGRTAHPLNLSMHS